MTPPDQPEQAPSALSRLERALAGFGEPKRAPEPEPEPELDEVVDDGGDDADVDEAEPDDVEPIPADDTGADGDEVVGADDDRWAAPSGSVLDIAAAVAAVDRLHAADPTTPAGERAPVLSPPPLPPTGADDLDEEPADVQPRFEPADLRARIHEFVNEDEDDDEADDVVGDHELVDDEPEPALDEAADVEADADAGAVADDAAVPADTWQRNIGDTTLPYFLVEDNAPVAADPVVEVEALRERIVRPTPIAEADAKESTSILRTLAEIPVLLVVAAVIAFLVKTFLAQAYYIPSGSMLPQLQIDDRVVVSKLAYKAHDPRRGDIVVFDDPRPGAATAKGDEGLLRKVGEGIGIVQPSTDEFIKRVIALPGETVEGKQGHVYINGQRLIEPYLKDTVVTSDFAKQTVRPGRLWVMGDNRTGSADSRVFGQIKIDTIVGRALVKVWPLDHVSFL